MVSGISIVLFGSDGGFSAPLLKRMLAQGLHVSAVVRMQHPSLAQQFPVMVQQAGVNDSLETISRRAGIKLLCPTRLDDPGFIRQLSQMKADLFLLGCFSEKIPACIWRDMPQACWNLHPSLLPAYRGPSPLYWQIVKAETDTGMSLHEVNGYFDRGRIVAQLRSSLPKQRDKKSLDKWVSVQGMALLYDALTLYVEGRLVAEPQNQAQASYFSYPRFPGVSR